MLLQEQTTAVFRALRRHRRQAALFLAMGPAELRRRWHWLSRNLGLEGAPAAAFLATAPSLLLADPQQAADVVRWLRSVGWRRLALRRNLARWPALLLTPVPQLEAAAACLQRQLDASVDELCLLLSVAPRLLALEPAQLAAAVAEQRSSWRLAAAFVERPPMMMRDAAVSGSGLPLLWLGRPGGSAAALLTCQRRREWHRVARVPTASFVCPLAASRQEALHLQVATLHVMHANGWSRQQVAELARECPTLLRGLRLH